MKIFISAAEASADHHAAELLRALRERDPEIQAFGIGGTHLEAAGFEKVIDRRAFSVMGFLEVLTKLPSILSNVKKIKTTIFEKRPDLAIVIDSPDFQFRLIPFIKNLGIPVVYYIPPKVWVWRKGRLKFLKKWVDLILTIFPFEQTFFETNKVPSLYIGNPTLDELPLDVTKEELRLAMGYSESDFILTCLAGSRKFEVNRHLIVFLDAAVAVAIDLRRKLKLKEGEKLRVLLPLPLGENSDFIEKKITLWKKKKSALVLSLLEITVSQGNAHACLKVANAGIIKSGTSTLEAALLGCPHVVVYRPSVISELIFRMVSSYRGPVALSNLVCGSQNVNLPFRELLGTGFSSDLLKQEITALFNDEKSIARNREAIEKVKAILASGITHSPAIQAADAVIELSKKPIPIRIEKESSVTIEFFSFVLVSFLWSTVNFFRRRITLSKSKSLTDFGVRVVSVGNIQAGGAGKTPLTAKIANEAAEQGKNVVILTRGYQSVAEKKGDVIRAGEAPRSVHFVGDEAALLSHLSKKAWIGVGKNRIEMFERVKVAMHPKTPDLVILDDGFQNFRIKKDVEVVAVTSKSPFTFYFRDFKNELSFADLVICTKGGPKRIPTVLKSKEVKIKFELPHADSFNKPLLLLTALSQGKQVRNQLLSLGYHLFRHYEFPDHASFSESFIKETLLQAENHSATLAMTGKDFVKCSQWVSRSKVLVFEPSLVFESGEDLWKKVLWE